MTNRSHEQAMPPAQDTRDISQAWLSAEKETAYKQLDSYLFEIYEQEGQDGLRELLITSINENLRSKYGRGPIDAELVRGVDFKRVTSASASKIAGQEITRPVFVFQSERSFKEFYFQLTGFEKSKNPECVEARGFVTDLSWDIGNGKKVMIKLIVSAPDQKSIAHEVRHSIDSNTGSRDGYDGILDELFAYYWETIVDRGNRTENEMWHDLRAHIWSNENSYYAKYTETAKKKMTYREYGEMTGKIIEAVKRIYQRSRDHIQTQREIVQLKSIEELYRLAGL